MNRIQEGYVGPPPAIVSSNLLNALSDMRLVEEGAIKELISPTSPTILGALIAKIRPNAAAEVSDSPAQQLWKLSCDVVADVLSAYLELEEQFAGNATDRVVEKLVRRTMTCQSVFYSARFQVPEWLETPAVLTDSPEQG